MEYKEHKPLAVRDWIVAIIAGLIVALPLMTMQGCVRKTVSLEEAEELRHRCEANGGTQYRILNPNGTINRVECKQYGYSVPKG